MLRWKIEVDEAFLMVNHFGDLLENEFEVI